MTIAKTKTMQKNYDSLARKSSTRQHAIVKLNHKQSSQKIKTTGHTNNQQICTNVADNYQTLFLRIANDQL